MDALCLLFSPSGRIGPQAFLFNVIAVYAVGIAAQWLAIPDIQEKAGIWPFAVMQALLIWVWYALHAKRLRDAARPIGVAVGAALLYTLSVVLLLIVATNFFQAFGRTSVGTAALNVTILLSVLLELTRQSIPDLGSLVVGLFVVMAFLPMIVALAVTIYAATRPSAAKP